MLFSRRERSHCGKDAAADDKAVRRQTFEKRRRSPTCSDASSERRAIYSALPLSLPSWLHCLRCQEARSVVDCFRRTRHLVYCPRGYFCSGFGKTKALCLASAARCFAFTPHVLSGASVTTFEEFTTIRYFTRRSPSTSRSTLTTLASRGTDSTVRLAAPALGRTARKRNENAIGSSLSSDTVNALISYRSQTVCGDARCAVSHDQ